MSPLSLDLSEDRTTLTVGPNDGSAAIALTAEAVDDLMRRLADCRSRMIPVHPAEPPSDPASAFTADNLLWSVRPSPHVAALELAIQHAGLGWIVTTLSRAQVEDLQTSIEFTINEMQMVKSARVVPPAPVNNVVQIGTESGGG